MDKFLSQLVPPTFWQIQSFQMTSNNLGHTQSQSVVTGTVPTKRSWMHWSGACSTNDCPNKESVIDLFNLWFWHFRVHSFDQNFYLYDPKIWILRVFWSVFWLGRRDNNEQHYGWSNFFLFTFNIDVYKVASPGWVIQALELAYL